MTQRRRPIPLHRDAVILEELGADAILTQPAEELAVILDLGGKLNRLDARVAHRYVMSPAQAAELIAELVLAARRSGGPAWLEVLDAELERARGRIDETGG